MKECQICHGLGGTLEAISSSLNSKATQISFKPCIRCKWEQWIKGFNLGMLLGQCFMETETMFIPVEIPPKWSIHVTS